jgi:hypothetical protein
VALLGGHVHGSTATVIGLVHICPRCYEGLHYLEVALLGGLCRCSPCQDGVDSSCVIVSIVENREYNI